MKENKKVGRPSLNEHRVLMSVRVKQETKDRLTDCAKKEDTSVGKIIDQLTENI